MAVPGRCVAVRVLGPVEITVDDRPVDIGGSGCAVIVILALADGHPVPLETLVEALWGESAPPDATTRADEMAADLRRELVIAGAQPGVITRAAGGYVLRTAEEPDLWTFDRLVTEGRARASAGWMHAAGETYRAALRLWRGAAFGGVSGAFVEIEAARLEELRLTVLEERIDLDLKVRRHADLVDELTELTARYPLRERLLAQLMLALYRCDRAPDALAAYRSAERFWQRELGQAPGVRLQQMRRAVAAGHPSLQPPRLDRVPPTDRIDGVDGSLPEVRRHRAGLVPPHARRDRAAADDRAQDIADP